MNLNSMVDRLKSGYQNFLHGTQPDRQQSQDYYEPQQQPAAPAYAQGYQTPYQQQAAPFQQDPFQAPAPEQAYYNPQQAQQPQQQAYYYQQPQQQAYQQPQQAPQQAYQPQRQAPGYQTQMDPYGQERNRRGGRHRDAAAESPMYAQPQPENLVQFPGASQEPAGEQHSDAVDAYVINVFNLNSCRQAMSCLRRGQCTLIVMDQLFDKAEIRRYVDMLTGACYALNGTMTRLSAKIGFYIMAPAGMTVYTDPTTANANAPRPAAQTPAYGAAPAAGSAAPRQAHDFSAQSAYGSAPEMSFTANQVEARQPAQEAYQQPYQQAPSQEGYQQQAGYQQAAYQANPYASHQEDQQRYAQ